MEAGGEYASNRSIASTAVDVVRPGATRFIAFFAWQSVKAGTDRGQLKISAKPDQSQQYAEIDFQIDAYIRVPGVPPHCPLSPPRPKQEVPMKMAMMTMMVLAVGAAGCADSGNGGGTGAR